MQAAWLKHDVPQVQGYFVHFVITLCTVLGSTCAKLLNHTLKEEPNLVPIKDAWDIFYEFPVSI